MSDSHLDDLAVLDFMAGRLETSRRSELDRHLDRCPECRALLASVARVSVPQTEQAVGRYALLQRIGRGGLGEVWAAHDPELDRKVAVKLLRPELEDNRWLVEEAQTMARITHGNVLAVYDAGRAGDRMFVAMEYVAGGTLRRWREAAPRAWRESLALMLGAGRGLAAAHAAGLVHRDFKPDNVLLGDDGRVVVSDFAPPGVGTPAYLAPELKAGKPATAASDQYAFCVVARDLLGERCPPRVRTVIARGLAEDPAARYRSMQALLRALERAAAPRWPYYAGAAAVIASAVAVFALFAARDDREPCSAPSLAGVWDAPRRMQLSAAFVATGKPYASLAARQLAEALDAQAAAWSAAHVEACRATRVRHVQSIELLDRRVQCLDERRAELGALVDVLARGELATMAKGARVVRELVPVERCADLAALASRIAPPVSAAQASDVHELRLALARMRAQQAAGHLREALPDATALLSRARTLGYGPAIGEAALELGRLQTRLGAYADARTTLQDAARTATSVYDNGTAAEAWTSLADAEGVGLRDLAAGEQATTWAQSLLGDRPQPLALAHLLEVRSKLAVLRGKAHDAEQMLRQVLAIQEAAYGKDDRMVADTLDELGVAVAEQDGQVDEQPFHDRAEAIRERTLGPGHPDRATTLERLGLVASRRGKHDEAIARLREAVAIRRAGLGDSHPLVAQALNNLGLALRRAKHDDEAMTTLREALAIRERVLGPDHPDVATTMMNIANVLGSTNHCADALALHERALAVMERAYGRDNIRTVDVLTNVATAEKCLNHPELAIEPYRRILAIQEARAGASSPTVGRLLAMLGDALTDAGQLTEAVSVLERASAILDRAPHVDPEDRSATHYRLGVALWRASKDPAAHARARTLVETALRELLALREADPSDVRDLRQWLATHR